MAHDTDSEPGGGTNRPTEVDAQSRDGTLDVSSYSIAQLQDLLLIIDSASQPQNHARLLSEIARRRSAETNPAPTPGTRGRFSARDGWLGWMDAKRRRSPVYGAGSLELSDKHLTLHGEQRTWLGMTSPGIAKIPYERIRNVARDGEWLQFESKQPYRLSRRIRFKAPSASDAENLAAQLPREQSIGFEERWAEIRTFEARVAALGGRDWSVAALVVANILMFVAMATVYRRVDEFDLVQLTNWGANFGPATINGQWWRLVSAQFVHANLLHLLANMWVLFNGGRLARRLFGNPTFLGIYFGAGVCGYLASTAWNPANISVGASGAIFGVLGAFIAFLLRQRAQMPAAVLRAHWMSTLVFIAFNLVSGVMGANIDNAAHFGGVVSGFVLGWLLARPLEREVRARFPLWQCAAAVAFIACISLAAVFQVRGIGSQLTAVERFTRDNEWYVTGERENIALWQQLAGAIANGAISNAEVSRRFEHDIIPFWKDANAKLGAKLKANRGAHDEVMELVKEFARLRLTWAQAIADAMRDNDESRARDSMRLMDETDQVQSQIDRMQMRAVMDHRPQALAHSLVVNRIRAFFDPHAWKCVEGTPRAGRIRGSADSTLDAPAMRHKIGCQAQSLFHEGDYETLDALLRNSAAKLNDLPDGESSVTAEFGSLATLIYEGGYQLDELMGKTADWRRAVDDPLMAELVEVMIFQQWAWSARGHGGASEVSGQGWYLFKHRSEMAAAALRAIEKPGESIPVWHDLSIDVALDLSRDTAEIRKIFDRGIGRFPQYEPLYASMLRVLMPRWQGSYEQVDKFIVDATGGMGADQDIELYANLYWTYFLLEQDDCNIFVDGQAAWSNINAGFVALTKRHPRSDYLLNAYAVLACQAGDAEKYAELRPKVERHPSGSAWSTKYSLATCDQKMHWEP